MPRFFSLQEIYFSLKTLSEMIKLYDILLNQGGVKLHSEVDIAEEQYQLIINKYKKACEEAIHSFSLKNPRYPKDKANIEINVELETSFTKQMADIAESKNRFKARG